jgi:2-dehydro-3-deoxyphosphogluconate aldolase/(4S)-4-hydroxy-2-oxoglutarate aldolase
MSSRPLSGVGAGNLQFLANPPKAPYRCFTKITLPSPRKTMILAQALPTLKLMPLVAAESAAQAIEDATIFRDAGYPYVEVLCRTPQAVEIIGQVTRALPDLFVGAGTVLTPERAEAAIAAGAKFLVSPALDPAVMEVAKKHNLQYMPGVYTATEVAIAYRNGYTWLKLFPIITGGLPHLDALGSPFGHTGLKLVVGCGVTKENYAAYLQHPMVGAIIPDWLSALRGKALRDEISLTKKLLQSV